MVKEAWIFGDKVCEDIYNKDKCICCLNRPLSNKVEDPKHDGTNIYGYMVALKESRNWFDENILLKIVSLFES